MISIYSTQPFDWCDSYGRIACELARHCEARGQDVSVFSLGPVVKENQPEAVRAITQREQARSAEGSFVIGIPTRFAELDAPAPRLALAMFESTRLPQEWLAPLNQCQAVIVPSRFCAAVFDRSGVEAAIYVVPLGVGDIFQPVKRRADRPLTFLAFLDRGGRKGGMVALQAFLRAFGQDERYQLIIKSRSNIFPFTFTNPNIEVIQQDMSEPELYELYQRCDVLIHPSEGEGFGMIPREFAATGGISLATAWSGTAEQIDAWGWPLPYSLKPATYRGHAEFEGRDLGQCAHVSADAVADVLREVAANIDSYRAQADEQAPHVAAHYSWSQMAEASLSLWQSLKEVA